MSRTPWDFESDRKPYNFSLDLLTGCIEAIICWTGDAVVFEVPFDRHVWDCIRCRLRILDKRPRLAAWFKLAWDRLWARLSKPCVCSLFSKQLWLAQLRLVRDEFRLTWEFAGLGKPSLPARLDRLAVIQSLRQISLWLNTQSWRFWSWTSVDRRFAWLVVWLKRATLLRFSRLTTRSRRTSRDFDKYRLKCGDACVGAPRNHSWRRHCFAVIRALMRKEREKKRGQERKKKNKSLKVFRGSN